ncbi:hypothetical protein OLZ31_26310 [Enterobacter asburiae]|nr:hypothetical protein [Enterobacter asburiae]
MNSDRLMKDAIDFDELKKERKSCCIEKEINEEWLLEHPKSSKSLGVVAEMDKRIDEIDALLVKEPPSPELPPRSPLIKVSGVLEEIDILFARGYFTDREYEPEEFDRKEMSRQWGSVMLAIIGESAAAAVNSQDDVRPTRKYDFVKGKINGRPFHGWLGRVTAQPGDFIELVAIEKEGRYEVYALTIPDLHVISVIPECDSGSKSRGLFELKSAFYLWLTLIVFLSLLLAFMDNVTMIDYINIISLSSVAFAIAFSLIGAGAYFSWLIKPRPSALLAQEIFTKLGLSNPEAVNLDKYTRRIIQKIPPSENNGRVMPNKDCSSDYYFYY